LNFGKEHSNTVKMYELATQFWDVLHQIKAYKTFSQKTQLKY
jgi:hypothetical protein